MPNPYPPALEDGYRVNFETLQEADRNGDLALVSAIRKADNQPVALICAVSWDGSDYQLSPLAVMCEGNPYEDFIPPTT